MSTLSTPFTHTTVLLHEAVDALAVQAQGVYVDATFGRGGHSRLLLQRLGPAGRLLALDRDPQAVEAAKVGPARLDDPRFSITHSVFSQWASLAAAQGAPLVDGVLMDLGVSSPQIDNPERGFSFRFDAPLDMRMDPSSGETAAEFLARADEQRIAAVLREFGEERFAVQIARAIVAQRDSGRALGTTKELQALVARHVKTREGGQDPATRTFQALRLVVNAELQELELALQAALHGLAPGGRLVVISFHSLEDRIVKTFIARQSKSEFDRRAPFAEPRPVRLNAVARVKPSAAEIQANPRSRSAVMRVAERTAVAMTCEAA